jgi:hypothetical protein
MRLFRQVSRKARLQSSAPRDICVAGTSCFSPWPCVHNTDPGFGPASVWFAKSVLQSTLLGARKGLLRPPQPLLHPPASAVLGQPAPSRPHTILESKT